MVYIISEKMGRLTSSGLSQSMSIDRIYDELSSWQVQIGHFKRVDRRRLKVNATSTVGLVKLLWHCRTVGAHIPPRG